MQYEKLSKKALKCMYVGTGIQFVVLTAIITVLIILFNKEW